MAVRALHLSHVVDPAMPLWPGDPQVSFETVAKLDAAGFFLRRFSMGEHSGTHVNAPSSFLADGASVDDLSAGDLVLPGVLIDVAADVGEDADFTLGEEAVGSWEERHGRIPEGSLVMLRTGWQRKWTDPVAYLGRGPAGAQRFPGFGPGAARLLFDRRGVKGLGIDTHGIDGGADTRFEVNRLVLDRGGLVVENLCNLDRLPVLGSTIVVGVIRLRGGSGSPAAVIAVLS